MEKRKHMGQKGREKRKSERKKINKNCTQKIRGMHSDERRKK